MIKLKSLLIEEFTDAERRADWLSRHRATFDSRGRVVAYHGTTPTKAKLIKQTGFRDRSYFALDKSYAKHWGSYVFKVYLPLDAIEFSVSQIVAIRPIKYEEVI